MFKVFVLLELDIWCLLLVIIIAQKKYTYLKHPLLTCLCWKYIVGKLSGPLHFTQKQMEKQMEKQKQKQKQNKQET